MSKSGVACYRNGGCGPYEMLSCSECPASKSDYLQAEATPKHRIDCADRMTNADKYFRNATNEELSCMMRRMCCPVYLSNDTGEDSGCIGNCKQCWLDWLKQEV